MSVYTRVCLFSVRLVGRPSRSFPSGEIVVPRVARSGRPGAQRRPPSHLEGSDDGGKGPKNPSILSTDNDDSEPDNQYKYRHSRALTYAIVTVRCSNLTWQPVETWGIFSCECMPVR